MGEYITNKKDMKFQSIDALKPVESVILEAGKALNDHSRTIDDSPIGEMLARAVGVGAGVGVGFAGLCLGGAAGSGAAVSGLVTTGGIVGGGMAASIGLIAAPAVILGGIGFGIASHIKKQKLMDAKELTYKNAIAMQTAIIKELVKERDADQERIKYLTSINTYLQAAIKDLGYDLGY